MSRARLPFTLLSRPGCHLCETMAAEFHAATAGAASLQVVDVDSDPLLQQRYGLRIPVLLDPDGGLCCEVQFDGERVTAWTGGG